VANCWALADVAADYHEFIVSFRPLMALLRESR
jgi:phenylacetic acid degradation operon negative regulatory protein